MTYLFKLARRTASLRALVAVAFAVVFAGCSGDSLTSSSESTPVETGGAGSIPGPSFSTSFRGGIPFGHFQTPYTELGSRYNGTLRSIYPEDLVGELSAIRDRGGKVVLNLAGSPNRYTDGAGNFSLSLWKASIDRYKNVNFSAYITDGTIIGNFLIDEPNDPSNWNGKAVSESTLEEMARYSKTYWPGMATIVRVRPEYLTGTYRYLDAAWAQYLSRFGDPGKFVSENVAQAKNKGLALLIGFNILKGNDGSPLTASQIESWGSEMLADTYSCAFLSWMYDERYLDRSDIGQALAYLSAKAANRATKSCKGGDGQTSGGTDSPTAGSSTSGSISLAVDAIWSADGRDYVRLKWSGARTSTVDVYRNGEFRKNVENDGKQTFIRPVGGLSSYTFKLCEKGSTTCSGKVTATFK